VAAEAVIKVAQALGLAFLAALAVALVFKVPL
jgi:hypothetical protein